MYNPKDYDEIKRIIDAKRPDGYVIPLYVQLYNDRYAITEINSITSFNPAAFRIGFGAKKSILDRCSFPECMSKYYSIEDSFVVNDPDTQVSEVYLIFSIATPDHIPEDNEVTSGSESVAERGGHLNVETFKNLPFQIDPDVMKQVSYYYNMLKDFLNTQYQQHRKKLIEEAMSEGTLEA